MKKNFLIVISVILFMISMTEGLIIWKYSSNKSSIEKNIPEEDCFKLTVNDENKDFLENHNNSYKFNIINNCTGNEVHLNVSNEEISIDYLDKVEEKGYDHFSHKYILQKEKNQAKVLYSCKSETTGKYFMVDDSSKGGGMKGDNYTCKSDNCEIIPNEDGMSQMRDDPYFLIYDGGYILFNSNNSDIKHFNWYPSEIEDILVTQTTIRVTFKSGEVETYDIPEE